MRGACVISLAEARFVIEDGVDQAFRPAAHVLTALSTWASRWSARQTRLVLPEGTRAARRRRPPRRRTVACSSRTPPGLPRAGVLPRPAAGRAGDGHRGAAATPPSTAERAVTVTWKYGNGIPGAGGVENDGRGRVRESRRARRLLRGRDGCANARRRSLRGLALHKSAAPVSKSGLPRDEQPAQAPAGMMRFAQRREPTLKEPGEDGVSFAREPPASPPR